MPDALHGRSRDRGVGRDDGIDAVAAQCVGNREHLLVFEIGRDLEAHRHIPAVALGEFRLAGLEPGDGLVRLRFEIRAQDHALLLVRIGAGAHRAPRGAPDVEAPREARFVARPHRAVNLASGGARAWSVELGVDPRRRGCAQAALAFSARRIGATTLSMSEHSAARPESSHKPAEGHEDIPRIDVSERGAKGPDGQPQVMDKRLFVQLMVFECGEGLAPSNVIATLGAELEKRGVGAVLYEDVNAPRSIGVLAYDDDPSVFVRKLRPALEHIGPGLVQRHDFSMLGRTYSLGYEQDLAFWLLERPRKVMEDPSCPWAVWYPLRRSGAFAKLDGREQGAILREHAIIGRAYGAEDLAHDVRLACHGLDAKDNEFVVGLLGKELHPLSHVVQAMRKTRQTSEFIAQMGPFFVGRVLFQKR